MRLPTPDRSGGYDSALERRWAHVLYNLGLFLEFHPGSIYLDNGQTEYQPDFILQPPHKDEPEWLLEVKGDHNERIEKPIKAHNQFKMPVAVLKSGFIPSTPEFNHIETEWARWTTFPARHALRDNVGFIPPNQIKAGDYVSGDIFHYLFQAQPELAEEVRPLDIPHQAELDF